MKLLTSSITTFLLLLLLLRRILSIPINTFQITLIISAIILYSFNLLTVNEQLITYLLSTWINPVAQIDSFTKWNFLKNDTWKKLSELSNLSLSSGVSSSLLKIAKVVPVYKKDWKLDCYNYFLLSLSCLILKKYLKSECTKNFINFWPNIILSMTCTLA